MTRDNLPTGSLVIREHKGQPYYEAKWRANGRQVKRRVGPAWLDRESDGSWRKRRGRPRPDYFGEKEATVQMAALIAEHAEEQRRAPSKRDATFDDAAKEWLDHLSRAGRAKPSTLRDYRQLLVQPGQQHARGGEPMKGRIMKGFGGRKLDQITTADVSYFLVALDREDISPRTVNKHRAILHAIFAYAMKPHTFELLENPVSGSEKRREDGAGRIKTFTAEELAAIERVAAKGEHREKPGKQYGPEVRAEWGRINSQDAALFSIAVRTGLRQGELRALRWEHVNFGLGDSHLTVSDAISGGQVTTTKGRNTRTIPIGSEVVRQLDELSKRDHYTDDGSLVFSRADGGPLDGAAITRRFKKAQEVAGIKVRRFHDLRHTFCSRLVAEGYDPITVKQWAGHSSISTTERYLHARPRPDDAARIDRAFSVGEPESAASVDRGSLESSGDQATRRVPPVETDGVARS